MKLLICGSRQTTPEMIKRVDRVLWWFSNLTTPQDMEVIVGDADGIDAEVQRYCETYQFSHSIYYPLLQWNTALFLERSPRNATQSGNLVPVQTNNYLKRDEAMVRDADICVGIWNEWSRGTKYTCDFAKKQNKECLLFGKDGKLIEHFFNAKYE